MTTRGLIAWDVGHGFSRWHVPRTDSGETVCRCGLPIPSGPGVKISYSSAPGARVTPDNICHTCVLYVKPEDLPPEAAPECPQCGRRRPGPDATGVVRCFCGWVWPDA